MSQRFDSLQKAIESYRGAPGADFWQVLSSPFMRVKRQMVAGLIKGRYFPKAIDFCCGLGVTLGDISRNIGYGLGIDGAFPAIARARELYGRNDKLEFMEGNLEDLKQRLMREHFDLLIVTDALNYFDRNQQRDIFRAAWEGRVGHLLLEVRAVDPACPGRCEYVEGCDFRKVAEILSFVSDCNYRVIGASVSRFYQPDHILRRCTYSRSRRVLAYALRRFIDVATALFLFTKRRQGDVVYDPLALRLRLGLATWLCRQPMMAYFLEPAIGHIALLCRRRCDT